MVNSRLFKKNDSRPRDTLIKGDCSRERSKIGEEEENQSKPMHMSQKELWSLAYKADWMKRMRSCVQGRATLTKEASVITLNKRNGDSSLRQRRTGLSAQLIKCLPQNHEPRNLDPQSHAKIWVW